MNCSFWACALAATVSPAAAIAAPRSAAVRSLIVFLLNVMGDPWEPPLLQP
jgi:hypothetical protein